ncbi:MAG: ATP synthase F1 subunit delta [candidate division Zixibacteria bacterium]|nr:ATP synthase F1 subunit delta [candidate division Zixibacteria bacterium]
MLAQEVARKYAQALFMAAQSKGLIDAAHEQLEDLRKFIAEDDTLLNFLNAPQVLDENKQALIRTVFGERLEQLFVEFLVVLVDKHRVAHLAEIIDDFIRLVEAEKGIARATVITAKALDEEPRRNLIARLAAKTNLTIQIEEKIDPAIMGGMIVILHNEIIDGSVRYGLEMIEEQLAKVKVV